MRSRFLLCLVFLATSAAAAPPPVPTDITYQGLLLDDQGAPRTGPVDLTLRIFDALAGGALIYKESHTAESLTEGVFSVTLGPTGDATDTPTDPLTTSLETALAGDVGPTAPGRYLEVTVGAEGALARHTILTVPYSLRSSSADHASTADFATLSASADQVGGLDASFVSEIYEHTNLDGSGPGNSDPTEGLADSDLDGVANFVDADNDNDGLSDTDEVIRGSDINLPSPVLTSISPTTGLTHAATPVSVQGANFEAGMTVTLGGDALTPTNLTPSSFDATAGPSAAGLEDLAVTLANGENDVLVDAFLFANVVSGGGHVDVYGAQPAILLGDDPYLIDADGDTVFESSFPIGVSRHSIVWDPTGRPAAVGCPANSCGDLELYRDTDGDFELLDETPVVIENFYIAYGLQLAFDAAGRAAAGYIKRIGSGTAERIAVVAHDRDGDGSFNGVNERVEIESGLATLGTQPETGDLALDPAGNVAYAYYDYADLELHVAWDRSGDGDFDDIVGGTPELAILPVGDEIANCLGVTFDGAGRLAVVYAVGELWGGDATLARDLNGDGDLLDGGEVQTLSTVNTEACDVASGPGVPLAVVFDAPSDVRSLVDLNGDDDFLDPGEDTTTIIDGSTSLSAAVSDAGDLWFATSSHLSVPTQ